MLYELLPWKRYYKHRQSPMKAMARTRRASRPPVHARPVSRRLPRLADASTHMPSTLIQIMPETSVASAASTLPSGAEGSAPEVQSLASSSNAE